MRTEKQRAIALLDAYDQWAKEQRNNPITADVQTISLSEAVIRQREIYNAMIARDEAAAQEEHELDKLRNSMYYISYNAYREGDDVHKMVETPYYNIEDCLKAYRAEQERGFFKVSIYQVHDNFIEWFDVDAYIASHGDDE